MSTTSTYHVTGMTCGGCAGKVAGHVEQIPGVSAVDTDVPTGRITVTGSKPVSAAAVQQAVEQAGYRLAAN